VQIVVDWDGTVTEADTLHAAIGRFGDVGVFRALENEIGRRLTLREVIATEMATIETPLEDVVSFLLDTVTLRPGFRELVLRHDPLVVSMGFHELIAPLLERDGIEVRVVANRLDPSLDGWRSLFREQELCRVCGEPCKRSDVAGLDGFVYVGDGFSDRCVALAASRVFARAGLADYLAAKNVPFEAFTDFYELDAALGLGAGPKLPLIRDGAEAPPA
jgi:2-hydroxy-3-keto-5-methylthiopentenyl-1-phosphate phosphatase